jgi:ParB family transcriptional regulator, chromosome partitioning protein
MESPAVTASSRIRNIPLSQLVLSPANVRKTKASAAEDAELEASIRAKGILQNLIVHPATGTATSVYEVHAGSRRLMILQKLAAEGVIDGDNKIPCKIEEPEDAAETSLAENTIRVAMHPADEFVAMAALIDAGAAIEDVALRFGTSERRVRQRLRLGNLAPELLDAFRAGDIGLEAVTAFTLGADHAAQLAVWAQLKEHSYISPHRIRHLLTESAIALDSDLGLFVGVETYEAAGGTITRDLFSADDEGFMDDVALVRRLAIEKLEAKAAELRVDWAWVKAALDLEYGALAQYARLRPQPAEVPAELAVEIEQIERRLGEVEEIDADAFTGELAAEAERLEERRAQIDDLVESLAVYSDKDRARAGVIVTIGDRGEFRLHEGLVERTTVRDAPDREAGDGNAGGDDETWMPVRGEDDDCNVEPSSRHLSPEQALRKECGFSQSLVDDLKAHRYQITRAHMAGNFAVAFDLTLYGLCSDVLDRFRYHTNPLDLRVIEETPCSSLNDLSGTPADRLIEAQHAALDLHWLKLLPAEGFEALAALPPSAKQKLFAWCIASCLKPQLAIEDRADPVLEAAGSRLAIPFADCWRPTAANYWSRVKKAHGLAIGAEILGERWARDHADDKKPVLAAALETAFDPAKSEASIALGQTARDQAAAWLPPGMAYDHVLTSDGADGPDDAALDRAESDDIEPVDAELPAFLTEDEPGTLDPATAA